VARRSLVERAAVRHGKPELVAKARRAAAAKPISVVSSRVR
jgi:hypothetical protein